MLRRSECRSLIVDAAAQSQLDQVLVHLTEPMVVILPECPGEIGNTRPAGQSTGSLMPASWSTIPQTRRNRRQLLRTRSLICCSPPALLGCRRV